MELIIIDESRLKIMLTPTDMRHYDLHSERMTAATGATRRAFRHIFDDARERIGFDTTGERLFVQLYNSRGGGCEIFVTKLGAEEAADPHDGAWVDPEELSALSDGEEALLSRLFKEDTMPKTVIRSAATSAMGTEPAEAAAYRLGDAEVLFALCRRLSGEDFAGESAVYIEEARGRTVWYLFLTPPVGETLPCHLAEYAPRVEDAETLRLYLAEHGRMVCESGAVEVLGRV